MTAPTRVLLAGLIIIAGCSRDPAPANGEVTSTASSQPTRAAGAGAPSGSATVAAHGHHPPIDCPLAKHGIDQSKLRPFEDVEKYIAFLERPDRAGWQKPEAVIKALELKGDETIADLGAGSGYFAFRFAEAVPRGQVFAVDVEPEMVRHMHHRAMTESVENLHATLSKPAEPHVPANADLVFICDVLHHVTDRPTWLSHVHGKLAAGARLVVIEFKEGDLPEGPPASVKLKRAEVEQLLRSAGFKSIQTDDQLLPYQFLLQVRR